MRRQEWRSMAVVGAMLCLQGAAWAQAPQFFYCYAPDPARNTVHVSPVMPIGPVEERSRYGDEFVAYLLKQGKLTAPVQGYCSMGPSPAHVARAQARLPVDTCPECGGASNFEAVAWPRGSQPSPPLATGLAQSRPQTAPSPAPSIEILDFSTPQKPQPMLVIMGNASTGRVVVLKQPDSASADAIQRKYAGVGGWRRLLITGGPGYGAAACAAVDGKIEFFVVHEQRSEDLATLRAKQYALQSVDDPALIDMCHPGWNASAPGDNESLLDSGIDAVRQRARDAVVCAPDDRPCHERNRRTPTAVGVRG